MKTVILFLISISLGFQAVSAQDGGGSIQGTVYVSGDTTVVTDATVTLVGLNYSQQANTSGEFFFEEVPAGSVLLRVESLVWGRNSQTVTVVAGETAEVRIEVLMHVHLEEIIVSAGPVALAHSKLVNPVHVVTGNDLIESNGISLGEALKNQAGISSTYFGPGASRPIINGVGGSRVRILQNGLEVGDVSDQNEDHAVGVDAFDANRIEIIRGPAALLYGSEITGGVVNVLGAGVPNERPVQQVEGLVRARGGLGANERGAGGIVKGVFSNIVWRASGLLRETGNINTPEFNPLNIHGHHEEEGHRDHEEEHGDHEEEEHVHEEEENGEHGHEEEPAEELVDHIENSRTSMARGSLGLSWLGKRGYIGGAVSFHNTDYGVPGGHGHAVHEEGEHAEEEEGIGEITVDLESINYDVEGAYRFGQSKIQGLRFRFGVYDYTHTELEHVEGGPDVIGAVYDNNQWEGRLEVDHKLHDTMQGVVGAQIKNREVDISGSHGNLPTTTTSSLGIFALERIRLGAVNVELSGRMQWQSYAPENRDSKSFSAVSIGGGANYEVSEGVSLSISLARAAKIPSVTDLYASGLHAAVRSVERGNENLKIETTNNATVSGYVYTEPIHVKLTGYLNQSDNFIYLAPTGMMEHGNPILQTAQSDATIAGVEVETEVELFHRGTTHVNLKLMGDYVSGRLTSEEVNLPRIPPLRLGASLEYAWKNLLADLSVKRIGDQGRVFTTEEETEGYTMIDAKVSYRLVTGSIIQSLSLQGFNLANTLATSHTSLLKETVPLPGRDIRLTYTFDF